MLAFAVSLVACGDDDGASPDAGNDAGNCDARGCWVPLETFQGASLNCAETYAMALAEYQNEQGNCTYAFFTCEALRGAAYQYGFTGDNVQCYYDDDGALVGGVRTSDHGLSTLTGDIPTTSCYEGPDCDSDAGI